jgi:hypothetical protein
MQTHPRLKRAALPATDAEASAGLDRRAFLRCSGMVVGAGALTGALPPALMRTADAAQKTQHLPNRCKNRTSAYDLHALFGGLRSRRRSSKRRLDSGRSRISIRRST